MSGLFGDLMAATFGVKNPARQRGGRLSHLNKLDLDLYVAMMGVKKPYGQKGWEFGDEETDDGLATQDL